MKSMKDNEVVVEEYIQGEREAGRLLGPLQKVSFPDVHINPVGLIPKSEPGKYRMIVDLSAPKGGSVNDGVDRDSCSLSYLSMDTVAARVRELGRGALLVKFDIKSAYRNVPVHPDDRWLLGNGVERAAVG